MLAAFFVLSVVAFSVDATGIKLIEYPPTYPYHLCILTKEINTLEKYNETSSEEIKNYFIFQKELNKIKQKE